MTFDDVYVYTSEISSHTAYEENECRALFDAVMTLAPGGTILEIGCQYGRSTSILAQVAAEKNHQFVIVDPFVVSSDDMKPWESTMAVLMKFRPKFTLIGQKHRDVPQWLTPRDLDFVHIDGDHGPDGIRYDCVRLLPRLKMRGLIAFHDYSNEHLPDVKAVVDIMTSVDDRSMFGWENVSLTGTLKIMRKVKRGGFV